MSSSPSSPVENNISSAQAAEPVPEAQAAALSAHPSTINPAVPSAFPLRQNSLENVSDVPDAQHEGHQDVEVDVEAMDVVHHAHAPSIDTTACSTSSPQTAWYPDPPSCTNSARTRASRVPASPSFDEAEARSCAVSRVGGRVCAEEGESRATSRLNKFLNPAMNNKVEHEREHDVEIMPVGVGVTSVTASRTTLVDPPATTTTGSGRSLSSSCAPASPLSTIATAVNSYNQAAGGTGTLTLVPVLPQTSCYSKSATVGGDHGDDVDQQQQGSNQNGPAASSSTSTSSSTALLQPLPRQTRSAPSELAGLAATASAKNTGAAGGGAGITVAKVTTDGSSSSTVVNSIKTSLLSTPGRFVVPEDGSSTSMRGGTSTRPADVDVLKLGMVPFTSGAPATSTVLERTSCAGGPDEKEEGGKKQLLQGNDYIEKINLSPRFGTTSDHAGFLTSGADDHYARHRPGVSSLLSATSSKASASAPVAQQVLDRTTPRKERSEDLTSSSSGTSSDVELVQVRNRNASGSSAEVQHVDQEAVDTDLQPMTSSSSCTTSGAPEGAPRERPAEDAVADPSLIFDGSNNTSLFGSSDTTYVLNTTRSTSSTISSLASSRTTGCKQAALGGSSSCNSGSNLNLLLKGNDSCSTIDTTASSYSNCSSSGGSSSTTRIVGASGAAHEPSTQHDELSGSSSSTGNASSWSSKPGVDTVFDVTNPAAAAPVEEVLDPSKNDTASNHPPILVSRRSVSTPDCHSTSSRASSSLQELQSGGATSSTDNCSPQSRSYQGQQPAKMLTPSEGSSSGLLPDQHGSLVRSKSSSDILSPTGGGTTTCSSRHPPDADPWKGWRVLIDTYYLYYYNTYTNTSQWQLPKELHPVLGEWKQITTNSGNQFWWNNKAQLSLWEDPRQTYDVFSAVLSGNLLFLYLFVECGGKLEITHPDTNATLLHYAVASGNRRMVDYLMDKFFNIPTRTSSCSAEGQDKGASRGAGAGVDQVKGESTTSTTTKTSSSTCAADSVEGSFHWIDKEGNDPLVYTVRTGYWNLIKPLMSRFPVRITRSGGQQEDLRKKEDFLPTIPWNVEQALHLAYAMGAWECVRELQPYAGAGLRLKHAANGGHMDDDNTSAPARLDHGSSVGRTANENFNRFKTGKKSAEESSTSRTYSSGHIEVVTRGQHSSTTTSRSTPTHSSSRSPYDSWSADERSSEISDHRSAAGGVGSSSSAAVFFSPILQHQPVVAPVLMPLLDPNQKITRIVSNLVEGVLGPWEADSDDDEQFLDAEDHINQYEQLENFDQLAAEDDHVESLQDFSHEATAHELLAEHESLLSYSNAVAGAPASADGRGSEQLHQERYKKDLPDDVDAFAGAGQPAHNEAGDRKKFVLQKQQDQECGYANAEKDPEADPVEHVSSVFATEDQDQNLNFIPAASDSNYFSTFTRAEDSSLSFPSGHPSTASTSQKIVSEAEEQSDHTSTTDTTTTPNSADGSARARTSEGARDLTFPFIEQAPDCDESTSSIVPVEDQDRTRGQRTTQHQPFPEIKISETTALGAEAIREGTATTSDELDEESGSLAPLWTDRSEDFANYSATESCNPQEAGESELVLTGHKSYAGGRRE
ncbi:unnamed protein product [Amoebophrya sp. A120]|nr:unnamed protein product [Amoebophrya sp. A120]|eukprot:GSA120T00005893001.1